VTCHGGAAIRFRQSEETQDINPEAKTQRIPAASSIPPGEPDRLQNTLQTKCAINTNSRIMKALIHSRKLTVSFEDSISFLSIAPCLPHGGMLRPDCAGLPGVARRQGRTPTRFMQKKCRDGERGISVWFD
jgi:hypothetical protein